MTSSVQVEGYMEYATSGYQHFFKTAEEIRKKPLGGLHVITERRYCVTHGLVGAVSLVLHAPHNHRKSSYTIRCLSLIHI